MRLDTRPSPTPSPEDAANSTSRPHASPTDETVKRGGLYRVGRAYGHFIHRFRWVILALWLIGLGVSVPFAASVSSVLQSGGYSFDQSESAHANNTLSALFHQPPSSAIVVFQSPTTPVSDAAYQQELSEFMTKAATFSHVTGVTLGSVGKDGMTTEVTVAFDEDASTAQQLMPSFQKLLPSGPAKVYLGGGPETYREYSQLTQSGIEQSEKLSLPIALIVLLAVFGTLVAAFMPLMLALVSVPVALAVLYAIATQTWTSIFVLNVATVVGLGISIDYSLFMTRRFREELAHGRDVRDAISMTVATTGEAILFSGLTVIIGFCGLLLIGIPFMTSFGVGGAVTVASAVLGALTLMPAVLSILGNRVNSLRVPFLGRITAPRKETADAEPQGFWHRWALGVMRRPVIVLFASIAILVALGWPIFSMQVSTYGAVSLPKTAEAQQGADILSQQYATEDANPVYVVVTSADGSSMLTADNLAKVNNLTTWLAGQSHVTSALSLTQPPSASGSPTLTEAQLAELYTSGAYLQNPGLTQLVASTTAGSTSVITLTSNTVVDSEAGKALIAAIRAGDVSQAQGLKVQVGGVQALSLDFTTYLYGNFPKAILFILLATYLLLLLMFRSLLLPLKAVIVNVLSLAASYGVLVFVFQWGHFTKLLNFTSSGSLDSTIPILIFCLLFGLSMDYEVFLLSRIREEWERTHDNRQAVALGLAKTGGVITNAALLFIIVTGSFTFTSLLSTQELGLGMTVAVLVDATVVRTLLVPATMRLLGRWNWWLPGRPLPAEQAN